MDKTLYGIFFMLVVVFGVNGKLRSVESFVTHELVPDILAVPPEHVLNITFPSGAKVLQGNQLSIEDVDGFPTLLWNAKSDSFYTVIMCDADAPSRVDPNARSYLHWLVTNVRGGDISSGEEVVELLNSHPEPYTGFHRYVLLIYEQPSEMDFYDLPNGSFEGRKQFSPDNFAENNNLGVPVAGNFYQTGNTESD